MTVPFADKPATSPAERTAIVAALPPRVAQAVHALLEASTQRGESVPLGAAEVCVYDSPDALTPQHTARALAAARKHKLCDGMHGWWFPTGLAWELRRALEDRVLTEENLDD